MPQTYFIPFLDFNNPIFVRLDELIRPLLKREPFSLNRELQIRSLLYLNFNNYLNSQLSKVTDDRPLNLLQDYDQVPESERLTLIAKMLNQSSDQIIDKFIKLFN